MPRSPSPDRFARSPRARLAGLAALLLPACDCGPGETASSVDAATDAPADTAADTGVAHAAPCTTPDVACSAALAVGTASRTLRYFRTHALGSERADITRAVVVLHGTGRDAEAYFDRVVSIAEEEDALTTTAIVAPRFATDPSTTCSGTVDSPGGAELYFSCNGWKHGDPALNDAEVDSFGALDALVTAVASTFPALERITLLGHSAGGQVAHRYAAVSGLDGAGISVPMRYVVANPSSYLYFDDRRLSAQATCADASACALDATSFVAPYHDAAACPGYDRYPYGQVARDGASGAVDTTTQRSRYLARDVVMLLGARDSDTSLVAGYDDLDVTCGAMAQGPVGASFRLQRGLAYHAYVTALGATHARSVVPDCGHSKTCMFESVAGRAAVFGP